MARIVLADAGFLVALINRREGLHAWAAAQAGQHAPPWKTCESALSEAFHLLEDPGMGALSELLRRKQLLVEFDLRAELSPVLKLMARYVEVPMDLADACLVRMTEQHDDAIILTTDSDFRIYRRNGRQVVPCVLPRRV